MHFLLKAYLNAEKRARWTGAALLRMMPARCSRAISASEAPLGQDFAWSANAWSANACGTGCSLTDLTKLTKRVFASRAPAGASRVRDRAAFGSAVRSRPKMTLSRLERACHGKQAGTGSARRPELARRFSSQTGGRCCLLFGPSGPRSLPGPPAGCYGWHQRSQRYCVYCAVAHWGGTAKTGSETRSFLAEARDIDAGLSAS
jgi:hypothetical protein